MRRWIGRVAGALAVAIAALSSVHAAVPDSPSASTGDIAQSIRDLLTAQSQSGQALGKLAADQDRIVEFYALRDFRPAWTGSDDATARAGLARKVLAEAESQGLRPKDYAVVWPAGDALAPSAAARDDVLMTAAVLRYALDVHVGRIAPRAAYSDVELPRSDFDAAKSLADAVSHRKLGDFFDALPPANDSYRSLVAALAHYRAVAAKGGWKKVSAKSGTAALAARLALEDPDTVAADDGGVADALMRYQARNGLDVDGSAGPDTVAALNLPVAWRIQQIRANLERERWLPAKLERAYVAVNAADQSLDFIRDGQPLLHSRVIVGKPNLPTPILRTQATAVIANPSWDIPDLIADEMLPHVRKDRNYLADRNIVLADGPADDPHGLKVDWSAIKKGHVPYQLRQAAGTGNVLGSLMLDMPNDFDVYLHDTSNKSLFDSDMRESSHGCVRVQEIQPLASLALTGDPEQGIEQISAAVATGETQRLTMDHPLPVYLLYRTAIGGDDGAAGFRPDRYGRDKRLIALLDAQRPAPALPALPTVTASK